MIDSKKQEKALTALQFILNRARWKANEAGNTDIGDLLELSAFLTDLIIDEDDRTTKYRETLVEISNRFTLCSHSLSIFDAD